MSNSTDSAAAAVKLPYAVCPKCSKSFKLVWDDYGDDEVTLGARGCPSGGIYDVFVRCPHCQHKESL